MATISPGDAAKLISHTKESRERAKAKRQLFVEAGWNVYQTDIYTFIEDIRVSASYIEKDDQIELFVFSSPSIIERFDTADAALTWFQKLQESLAVRK